MFYSEYLKVEAYEYAELEKADIKRVNQFKMFGIDDASYTMEYLKRLRDELQFGPELPEPTQADYAASERRVKEMIAEFVKFHTQASFPYKLRQIQARRRLAQLRGQPLFFDNRELVDESLRRLKAMESEASALVWPYNPVSYHRKRTMPLGLFDSIEARIMEIDVLDVILPDGQKLGRHPVVTLQRLKRAGLDLEKAWHRDTKQCGDVSLQVRFEDIGGITGIPEIMISFAGMEIFAYVRRERQAEQSGYTTIYHRTKGMWDNYGDMS